MRESLKSILLGLCATVKVIKSQKRKVTKEVHLLLCHTFDWAVVSPSVHRVLAHAWKVISLKDGFCLGGLSEEGLEALSEEGLEALNKHIREMRDSGPGRTPPCTT